MNLTTAALAALAAIAAPATTLAAQAPITVSASLGAGSGALEGALAAWRPVIRAGDKVVFGIGLRLSGFGGDPTAYTNRDAAVGGPGAAVTIDPLVYALNAAVFGEFAPLEFLAIGANLDLIGLAAGPERTSGTMVATPQRFSYFGYAERDHGALNSEFLVTLRVTPVLRLRAGISHYVTNYIVTDLAAPGVRGSRFQKFVSVPFVGVSLRL